jgi:chromosome segregation ATPase
MLNSLKEKQDELESTFNKIDQLEILVNKVKDTYNAVAENLDSVERTVSASTAPQFRLVNRRHMFYLFNWF